MADIWWVAYRFGLPLAAAAHMVIARWGRNNILFILGVPIFLLLLNMYLSSQQRPVHATLEGYKPFRRTRYKWHAADVIALVFLMLFEAYVAGAAAARERSLGWWGVLVAVSFGPYTVLSFVARRYLLDARAMIAHADLRIQESLASREGAGSALASSSGR